MSKKILCFILLGLLVLILVVTAIIKVTNQSRSPVISVGDSQFQQDPRSYPEYKADSGYRLTILNPELFKTNLSEAAIGQLSTNLKTALYDKTGSIPSVGSIVGEVSKDTTGVLRFSLQTDQGKTTYLIQAKDDGSIVSIEIKK